MCNGKSSYDLPMDYLDFLKDNTYMIAINEWNRITPNARAWYDVGITKFFIEKCSKMIEDIDCIVNEAVFKDYPHQNKIKSLYTFNKTVEHLKKNITVYSVLQLLRKYHADKSIFIYGLDCNDPEYNARNYTQYGSKVKHDRYGAFLGDLQYLLEEHYTKDKKFFDNIYCCNIQSAVNIPKITPEQAMEIINVL
jgi:hypothetical protein